MIDPGSTLTSPSVTRDVACRVLDSSETASTIQILVDNLFTRDRQVIPSHDSSKYVRAPRSPRKVRFVQEVGQCKRVFFLRLPASSYWQLPHPWSRIMHSRRNLTGPIRSR